MNISRPFPAILLCMSLLFLRLAMPAVLYANPGAVIDVFGNSEVNGDEIHLGDISRITGEDPRLIRKLRGVVIGRAPLPGKSRSIDEGNIRLRLKQKGIDQTRIRLKVPKKVVIKRGFVLISKEEIREVALAYIRQRMALNKNKVRIKGVRIKKEIILPKGDIRYRVEPARNTDFLGKVPLAVIFEVGRDFEKKVWAVVDIEMLRQVVVTRRPLRRYRQITEDDIEMREMDLAGLPSNIITDYDEILGKRTKRAIDANTVLRPDLIEFPPLVKRGDVVVVVAESGGLRMTTLGVVKGRSGRRGERIRVENIDSKKSIYARVMDANTVKVDF